MLKGNMCCKDGDTVEVPTDNAGMGGTREDDQVVRGAPCPEIGRWAMAWERTMDMSAGKDSRQTPGPRDTLTGARARHHSGTAGEVRKGTGSQHVRGCWAMTRVWLLFKGEIKTI